METTGEKPLLLQRTNPDFHKECERIAIDLTSQRTTMLEVVLNLKPYIQSTHLDKREEGIHILSTILEYTPITSLKEEEFTQFCQFYKGILNDNYKLIPSVLNGILALSKYSLPMKGTVFTEILSKIFQTVSCQSQAQVERLKLYKILKNMLRNQTSELLDMGPDFVYGVISAIDGERDPRNLLFIFEWLPEFIGAVKLGHLSEEMFEVMSCYFPVDFRVPPQDANGVSRDALAKALTPCLCASKDFAENMILLAFEKLGSDLQIAKCDSLQLLLHGCEKLPIKEYVENRVIFVLQNELMKCPPLEVEAPLLLTITAMSHKLSMDPFNFTTIFDNILDTNMTNLTVTEKFFIPACKLLLAMSKGGETCAKRILLDVQPCLMKLFYVAATAEHRVGILRMLLEFIKIGDRYNANTQDIPCFLVKYAAQSDHDIRALSLEALCFINAQFNSVKAEIFKEWGLLFIQRISKNVEDAFHQCVLYYAPKYSQEIALLVESLPMEHFEAILNHLCILSLTDPFIQLFTKALERYLKTHAKIGLEVLNKSLNLHKGNETLHMQIETCNILGNVLRCQLFDNLEESDLLNAMSVLMHIIGSYTVGKQAEFLQMNLSSVLDSVLLQAHAIYFAAGILANLHLENLQHCDCHSLYENLFALSYRGQQIAVELLANLINKWADDVVTPFIEHSYNFLSDRLDSNNERERYWCGVTTVWLTKALFMRGYKTRSQWTSLLLDYLKKSNAVAMSMETIMSDECRFLSAGSHCRKTLLYKQQFFTEMCQQLSGNFRVENDNYIVAFASLLQGVPGVILKINFKKLMRLIILCLDHSSNANGIIPILTAIKSFLVTQDPLGEQYFDDFLPRLLNLSQFPSSMMVRILALECIQLYINAGVPIHKLMKHKTKVTDTLSKCVDDKKRLVRKEAADARLKWFLLGAPI